MTSRANARAWIVAAQEVRGARAHGLHRFAAKAWSMELRA